MTYLFVLERWILLKTRFIAKFAKTLTESQVKITIFRLLWPAYIISVVTDEIFIHLGANVITDGPLLHLGPVVTLVPSTSSTDKKSGSLK